MRLRYVAVAEWQSRGAIHLHVVARVPRDRLRALNDASAPSRGRGRRRHRRIEREAQSVTTVVDGETIRWGSQAVAEVVVGERSMIRTAGYLAKLISYAVKDLTGRPGGSAPYRAALAEHHDALDAAAARLRCGERPMAPPASRSALARQRQWGMCEYEQRGGRPSGTVPFEVAGSGGARRGCRSLRHRQWGFRGHPVRKSRSWSVLTVTECRSRRREHGSGEDSEQSESAFVWERPSDGLPMTVEVREWCDKVLPQIAASRAEAERLRRRMDGQLMPLF